MTKEQLQDVRADIAFMRALAEQGSQAPLLGGGIIAAAGAIFGLASVIHWMIQSDILQVSPWFFMVNWIGAGAVFGIACTLLIRRARGQPGMQSAMNRATSSAWSAVGFSIFVTFLGMMAVAWTSKSDTVFYLFPVMILALYGAAWTVAADFTRKTWIRLVALASFASAVLMGLLTNHPMQMLAYAGALFFLALVPGLILLRQEPSDTI